MADLSRHHSSKVAKADPAAIPRFGTIGSANNPSQVMYLGHEYEVMLAKASPMG